MTDRFEEGWNAARDQAVAALKAESAAYEEQFGTRGRGGLTAAVFYAAAEFVKENVTAPPGT